MARGVDDVDAVTVLLECNRILLGLRVAPVAGGSSGSDDHLFEQRTALLIGEDGVLEVRLLLVVYNLLDVGTLLPDSRFDGWVV